MYRRLSQACIAAAISSMVLVACGPNGGGSKGSSEPSTVTTGNASALASTPGSSTFLVRFDGLYYTPKAEDNVRSFVRYFKDGKVCEAGQLSDKSPDDVRVWMKPGNSMVSDGYCGKYDTTTGGFTTNKNGRVDFKVLKFGGGKLVLQSTSYIKGYEGVKSPDTYVFSKD
jgi:hypothetical protein